MFIWEKMKKISLLSTLLLTSSMLYAGWTRYEFDSTTGVYTSVPEYSCLEMMCEHDCVENSETGEGECCPALVEGRNCVSDTRNEKGCILSLKKTCPSNQYCNKSTQNCQLIPSCNPCQKFDKGKGQCVADTSKNNQAVGACGKCNNGSVVTDTTKVNPCKTCNTSNWGLTNKANGTQVQDVCHMCKDGNVVLKDPSKKIILKNSCVECLNGGDCSGELTCNKKFQCTCPSGSTSYTKADGTVGCCSTLLANDPKNKNTICCPVLNEKIKLKAIDTARGEATKAGRIGPYTCNYNVFMTYGKFDDSFCLKGKKACTEYSYKTTCHQICDGDNCSDKTLCETRIEAPKLIYTLPAGKTLDVFAVNNYDNGNAADTHLDLRLKLVPTKETKEICEMVPVTNC